MSNISMHHFLYSYSSPNFSNHFQISLPLIFVATLIEGKTDINSILLSTNSQGLIDLLQLQLVNDRSRTNTLKSISPDHQNLFPLLNRTSVEN